MAHYDLEEQEQIDSIKTWWKMYGNLVTGIVVAASLAVVSWQGWTWYQRNQTAKASAIYAVLEQAAAVRDAQKVKVAAGELAEKFGGTAYASLGALVAAHQSFEAGDLKTEAPVRKRRGLLGLPVPAAGTGRGEPTWRRL